MLTGALGVSVKNSFLSSLLQTNSTRRWRGHSIQGQCISLYSSGILNFEGTLCQLILQLILWCSGVQFYTVGIGGKAYNKLVQTCSSSCYSSYVVARC